MHNLSNSMYIDDISLERVNEFKYIYLGVWMTDRLEWLVDVNKTVRRASKQAGIIYKPSISMVAS